MKKKLSLRFFQEKKVIIQHLQAEKYKNDSMYQVSTVKSQAVARFVSSSPQKLKSLNSSTSWLVATSSYRISSNSFRGRNYSFLNLEIQRSQYIRPKVTVHKGAETIQGRKLFKGGNYMRKYGIQKNANINVYFSKKVLVVSGFVKTCDKLIK